MSKFSDDVNRMINAPKNQIKQRVIQFMQTDEYQEFEAWVYPVDRIKHVYNRNYQNLMTFITVIKSGNIPDDDSIEDRNFLLTEAMTYLHNYASAQYSLVDILEKHAKTLPISNDLINETKPLNKIKVYQFMDALRNNLLHEITLPTSLRFDSTVSEDVRVVYKVSELLKYPKWANAKPYISSFNEYIVIEEIVNENHKHLLDFVSRYERILLNANKAKFEKVLNALVSFATEYSSIGEKGFLPVSSLYAQVKLEMLQ